MTESPNLPFSHCDILLYLVRRSLHLPAYDDARRPVTNVHVLLLHPRHVERHHHLHSVSYPRNQLQSPAETDETKEQRSRLTFLPSGDSRKFTLHEHRCDKRATGGRGKGIKGAVRPF